MNLNWLMAMRLCLYNPQGLATTHSQHIQEAMATFGASKLEIGIDRRPAENMENSTSWAQHFTEDKAALIVESEAGQDLNTLLDDKPFTAIFPGLLDLQVYRAFLWSHAIPLVKKRAQHDRMVVNTAIAQSRAYLENLVQRDRTNT